MKVVIAGLTDFINYGDQLISRCVEYLVQQTNPEIEIAELSFESHQDNLFYKCLRLLQRAFKKIGNYFLVYRITHIIHRKVYEKNIKNTDAIIFACGSFKYGTQLLWAYYSIIIELAYKYGIPVMFDAMNVQQYKEKDWRCRCLKRHLNYPNVKIFTTRDGLPGVERINLYYKTNENLLTYPVGDPAYWVPECYEIKKNEDSNVIGINLIQGRNFIDYGGTLTNENVIEIYDNLITELIQNNIKFQMFTNGLSGDYRMGLMLIKRFEEKGIKLEDICVPKNDKDLVKIISNYKLVVGARLHACICAYSLDIPVVGMIWDEKILNFSKMAGIENSFFDEATLSGTALYLAIRDNLDRKYDRKLREKWKSETKNTIERFLQMCHG